MYNQLYIVFCLIFVSLPLFSFAVQQINKCLPTVCLVSLLLSRATEKLKQKRIRELFTAILAGIVIVRSNKCNGVAKDMETVYGTLEVAIVAANKCHHGRSVSFFPK